MCWVICDVCVWCLFLIGLVLMLVCCGVWSRVMVVCYLVCWWLIVLM